MDQMDQHLPTSFSQLVASALSIAGCFFTISTEAPLFAVLTVPIMTLYFTITHHYRKASRELKRLESVTQSPMYQQFGETLSGLQVIRSYKRQSMFQQKFQVKVDENFSAYFAMKAADRWLSVRTELLGDVIVFFSALLVVMSPRSIGGAAGLAISNALSITNVLNRLVRCISETESHMNSVERILHMTENIPTEMLDFNSDCHSSVTPNLVNQMKNQSYTSNDVDIVNQDTIPSEMTDKELINAGWPWNGKIVFDDVYLRYRAGFETVLNGVSLEVNSGESLGIVGRTGSGKSSLFRILLRLNEFEKGQILIDGVDISKIGLDTLRSCISIIPQDAVLFSGSVR